MCLVREVAIEPVGVNVPVAGSNSSAVAVDPVALAPARSPPAISTRPFSSVVAVDPERRSTIDPAVGVYSAVCRVEHAAPVGSPAPPTISTRPSSSPARRDGVER